MNLKNLNDTELLNRTKQLVQSEREQLTRILHHLREVESRKLFSELGYSSLFTYALKELKYSESQAGRRISAMRLIKEIPEVEKKIETGRLSLSNVSKAQSFFRECTKGPTQKLKPISLIAKKEILKKLEGQSTREGERTLIALQPDRALPNEKERVLSNDHIEVRFVIKAELKAQLEELRSLLGVKGAQMSFAELVAFMSSTSIHQLKIKKFGKKRVEKGITQGSLESNSPSAESVESSQESHLKKLGQSSRSKTPPLTHEQTSNPNRLRTSPNQISSKKTQDFSKPKYFVTKKSPPAPVVYKRATQEPTFCGSSAKSSRYIPASTKYEVWQRDSGQCQKCEGRRNLNYDHVQPLGLGGQTKLENLRLLCFNCNQREAYKSFGLEKVKSFVDFE